MNKCDLGAKLLEMEQQKPRSKKIVLARFYPRPFTEELLADYEFIYEGSRRDLWRYDNQTGIWRADGPEFIDHFFRKSTDSIDDTLKKRNVILEIVSDVQGCAYRVEGLHEPDVNLIPFANGVYDLGKDTFRDFRSSDHFTWKLPHAYNPDSSCAFLAGLIDSMLDAGDDRTLWELMGYSLWRGYPNQKAFFFTGGGRNGKSTYGNILRGLIGEENISNASLDDIQNGRFAAGNLHRKLLNISGEVDYADLENTRLLKQLCGGDQIEADIKFKKPVKFVNYAKLLFLTNQLPVSKDTTDAFYRRAYVIPFPKKFTPDPSIDLKIRSSSGEMKAEFEGLSFRALQEVRTFKARNFLFTREINIDENRVYYQQLSNPLIRFIAECCERDPAGYIFKYEFLDRLNDWLSSKGFNTCTADKVGKTMKETGFEDGKRKPSNTENEEKRYAAWLGLVWPVPPVQPVQPLYNSCLCSQETVVNTLDSLDTPDRNTVFEAALNKCPFCERFSACMLTEGTRELCDGPYQEARP